MFSLKCKIAFSFFLICAAIASNLEVVKEMNLNENLKPLAITSDETGNYYILDSSGKIAKVDSTGGIIAEIKPNDAGFIEPCGICYSGGWIYVSDISSGLIYIFDRQLLKSLTISLQFDAFNIRPDKFAVSPTGAILLWDGEKKALSYLQNINSRNPIQLIIPQKDIEANVVSLSFDKLTDGFTVIEDSNVFIYNYLGVFDRQIQLKDSTENPINAFTTTDGFALFYRDGFVFYDEGIFSEKIPVTIDIIIQEISGYIVIYDKNQITTYRVIE